METLAQFLPLLLLVGIFYLLVIRPARRRQHEVASLQASIEVGSRVMLASGIYGTVRALREDRADLEVAPGTVLEVARQAIVRVDEQGSASTPPVTPAESADRPTGADETA